MKKMLYPALAAALVVCSRTVFASTESLGSAIAREQKQLLQGIIDRMAHSIDEQIIVVQEPDRTRAALYTLRESLGKYSCEMGCICDTLRNCITEKCFDLAPAIEQCLRECEQRSHQRREMTPAEYALIQEKISHLTQEFFLFQLALLGKIDYMVQDTLQRYNLDTYAKLATPFALFVAYCLVADQLLAIAQEKLGVTHKDTLSGFNVIAPKTETKVVGQGESAVTKTVLVTPAPENMVERGYLALSQLLRDSTGLSGKELKFIPSILFIPVMAESFKKIKQITTETVQQTYSALINRRISSVYPVKVPRFGFEGKPKFAALKTRFAPVIDFCSKLTFYRTLDVQLTRGYILQGDLKDARDLGEAIAGELAARCQAVQTPYTYGVYDVHASKLLNTDIKKIMAECNEYGPAVLVINDIDWLCEKKNIKPHKYAEIINELTRAALQSSNGSTLVILTTRDSSKLERLLQESYRFTVIDVAQTF